MVEVVGAPVVGEGCCFTVVWACFLVLQGVDMFFRVGQ